MFESESDRLPMEMKRKIELNNGQLALMRISRFGKPNEYIDVLLKAIRQTDSMQLLAEYGNQNQVIEIGENDTHGEILTEDCVCKRDVPYINLTPIIPQNWHETLEILHAYKGGAILKSINNLEICSPELPNITFMQLENKK